MVASIMVQGTTSFAGKSFLVTVLCKIFADMGYRVAPFKSQNTSLNSYVTPSGGEIARAQAIQAFAAGVEPSTDMNPILIKPRGDSRSQIIVDGKPYRDINARDYYEEFVEKEGILIIERAFRRLSKKYDIIVIEGAGSPAEINLYHQDIANMRVAEITDSPVILIADIDRGGVFASIYGTIKLLEKKHQDRIKGVVINKFRGDIEILKPGLKMIEELTGKPVLGVLPYIQDLRLPSEDSVSLEYIGEKGDIYVIRLPRISNFTDFDPLIYSGFKIRFVQSPEEIHSPKAIIIPGTKSVFEDMEWMKSKGFPEKIRTFRGKVPIIGICGGYQMLGDKIVDRGGVEGSKREMRGLGLLNVETYYKAYKKTTRRVRGRIISDKGIFSGLKGSEVYGYEIHMGETHLGDNAYPVFDLGDKLDGAIDETGMIMGTYIHGIFDAPPLRRVFEGGSQSTFNIEQIWKKELERAARIVSENLDIERIKEMCYE
jgi:adenosylcobyric acid synthase